MKRILKIWNLLLLSLLWVSTNATASENDLAWNCSQWISAADAQVITGRVDDPTRAADGTSQFVATFTNADKIVKAVWMTTALGTYDIYVNGQLIGDEILKPGFTHYAKTRRSFTHDITHAMRIAKGAENTLWAEVTPGWWADKIITPSGHNGFLGKKCAFRGVLRLTYADGREVLMGTDTEHWRAGIAGQVIHAAIYDGEVFDARRQPDFKEILKTPEVNTEFNGEILPSDGAEIYLRRDLTLSPVDAYIWQGTSGTTEQEYGKVIVNRHIAKDETFQLMPGETLVVDFGQNCSAVPEFVFQAKEGTTLTCLPGELLNDGNGAKSRGMDGPEGSVHRRNLRIHENSIRLDYTFATTKNPVTYSPRHTFFGYRYLSMTATDEVTIRSIRSIPMSSITKEMETGTITTGNELVNRLIANTYWGQLSNYLSVTTDCPQRNERLGWTADTQVFAETGTFFANTDRFFHKWLRDLRDTQSPLGGYPGVAPPGQYGASEHDMMRVGWADAGIIVPWTIWKQYADLQVIEDSWTSMEQYMNHVAATKYDHTALVDENSNYQWGDWLSYEPLESCGGGAFNKEGPKPEAIEYWNYLSACYWLIDAEMMCDMAKATHRDATRWEQMVKEARAYIVKRFMNEKGEFKTQILNTMQTPALFALKCRIVEGEAKSRMTERLRQNFVDHGNCLQTGFLGTSILMQTLTDNGMTDIAYELLFQRKNPSWLYSVDNGATTVWERWNSYMKDKGMGPRGMNSFNHYAYGCVCQWLWETAAGIVADPLQPGFKHIIMRPVPDKRLGHLDASYHSAAGLIKSSWRYEDDKWTWHFTIPEGATATVTLPGESVSKEYASGSYTLNCDY